MSYFPRNFHKALLGLAVCLLIASGASAAQQCLVNDSGQWLNHLAAGRYGRASAMIVAWRDSSQCACPDAETACIGIPSENKTEGPDRYMLSAGQLAEIVQFTAAWEKQTRAACDPLLGSDSIGPAARNACLERSAEKAIPDKTPAQKALLGKVLTDAVKRLEKEKTGVFVEVEDYRPIDGYSLDSKIRNRSIERAKELASQICQMQKEIVKSEERIERIKRQPKKMARNKQKILFDEQQFNKRLRDAVERSRNEFEKLMRRDFNFMTDCAGGKLPEID